jgi:peptide/nickel transport system ATP-binding protein
MDVAEYVMLGRARLDGWGRESKKSRQFVHTILEETQLLGLQHQLVTQLSGGEMQRVLIARALVQEPEIMILDEPTSALDVSVQARFLDLLQDLQGKLNFACLFISHDLAVVDILAHRIAVMQDGLLVEEGDRDQILKHPKNDYTRRLISAVPVPDPAEQRVRREARLASKK